MVMDFRRQLIISFSIIVASVAAAAIVISILAGNVATESKKIQTDRGISSQETGVLAVLASLKEEAPQAATYQAAIDQLFPNSDGLIGFGDRIQALATADQVLANSSFQGNPTTPTDMVPGRSNISLEVDGSLNGITAFLKDLESTPGFLVSIPSFDLVANGGSYRLTAPGTIFFRP